MSYTPNIKGVSLGRSEKDFRVGSTIGHSEGADATAQECAINCQGHYNLPPKLTRDLDICLGGE
jgi:hypothetical protein